MDERRFQTAFFGIIGAMAGMTVGGPAGAAAGAAVGATFGRLNTRGAGQDEPEPEPSRAVMSGSGRGISGATLAGLLDQESSPDLSFPLLGRQNNPIGVSDICSLSARMDRFSLPEVKPASTAFEIPLVRPVVPSFDLPKVEMPRVEPVLSFARTRTVEMPPVDPLVRSRRGLLFEDERSDLRDHNFWAAQQDYMRRYK